MARLDVDPHSLQAGHDLELDLARSPAGPLEVAARVVGKGLDPVAEREEEELDLGRHQVIEPGRLGLLQQRAEHRPAVAGIRLAGGRDDLADQPGAGHSSRRFQDRERGRVGAQIHVRLDLASQSLHGRSVEPLTRRKDVGQASGRDRHGLDGARDVSELELDLLDSGIFGGGDKSIDSSAVQVVQSAVAVFGRTGIVGRGSALPPFERRAEGAPSCGVGPVLSGISFLPRGRGPFARLCVGMDEKIGDQDEQDAGGEKPCADPEHEQNQLLIRRAGDRRLVAEDELR